MTPKLLPIGIAAVLALASPAAAEPTITLHPTTVHRGEYLVVTGKGWSRERGGMYLGIRRPGEPIHVGNANVTAKGRFRFELKIESYVNYGRWVFKARQQYERPDGTLRKVRAKASFKVVR